MGVSAQLQLRQGQTLVMTPQLLQSIRLLQLSNVELEQFIAAEMEKNPLLRRAETDADAASGDEPAHWQAAESEPAALASSGSGESEAAFADPAMQVSAELDTSAENMAAKLDAPLDSITPDSAPSLRDPRGEAADPSDFEDIRAEAVTLKAHLRAQAALLRLDARASAIAHAFIDALDDNGYLPSDFAGLCDDMGVSAAEGEAVLARLHDLDPPGVFARSLSECLALQLKARDRLDPAMAALVAHLPLLAKRDFAALSPLCGVDRDDLIDMLGEIRRLDPKPGAAFLSEGAEPVIPDVIVAVAPDGGWSVQLNPDALPRVLVDRPYHSRISASARSEDDRLFLSECLKNATWLERSLDQRAKTILKVATEIVRQQDAFFLHGVSHLRPMNLRALAELVDMHESTISRVTVAKYMATPRGTFEMRYFFTAAIAGADDADAHSAESVRHRIRALIDAETPTTVLSDDALVDALKAEKVEIARRTVAKYREAMGIASSVERRREKRALAGA
jgi:RNA polymerase sigma-54 factor